MDRERLTWLRIGAVVMDGLSLGVAWMGAVGLRALLNQYWSLDLVAGPEPMFKPFSIAEHLVLGAGVIPLCLAVLAFQGGYRNLRRTEFRQLGRQVVSGVFFSILAMMGGIFFLNVDWVSRPVVFSYGFLAVALLLATRVLNQRILWRMRRRSFDPYRLVLVGSPETAKPFLEILDTHPEWGLSVEGYVSAAPSVSVSALKYLGPVESLPKVLIEQPVDEVYLSAGVMERDIWQSTADLCEELGIRMSFDANFLGLRETNVDLQYFDGWSLLSFGRTPSGGFELAVKRLIDFWGAFLGLLVLVPLFGVVALAIRLESKGPIFFVQERSGRFGRSFPLLKFRSMVVEAESLRESLQDQNEMQGPVFKIKTDPRITRVGWWLRRFSIDELPQLVNVLKGQMSLVGPRPPIPEEVAQYERWQLRRLSMRPGLTCIWQVSGRNEVDFDRWMELDLEYIDNWTLWLDCQLLLRTIPEVFRGTGAS